MINVLFVCLGNICRSPMAEGVFQYLVNQAGLSEEITVDSAGTGGWHVGEQAHRGTRDVLKRNKIPYDGRARQFISEDLKAFDYVLAMDVSNYRTILKFVPDVDVNGNTTNLSDGTEVSLFLHYAHTAGAVKQTEVPDPYYDNKFDLVYDLVTKGCEALLAKIRADHNL